MHKRLLCLPIILVFTACGNPAPTCATRGTSYTVCSNNSVWECPSGPDDVATFNKGVDAACQKETNPTACILNATYKMVDMQLKADCAAGGMVCVETMMSSAKSASCQMK